MNKTLLFSAAALAAIATVGVNAEVPTPLHFSDASINKMSPNGAIGVSQTYSNTKIFDLVSGQVLYTLDGSELPIGFGIGTGNSVSNTGIVLLSSDGLNAEFWKDGSIYTLDYPEEGMGTNSANGVTPDGKRICGYVGVAEVSYDSDVLMNIPCVWDQESETEYSKPIILPHPELDLTGRVPQYIMANYISEDGKTVLGCMRDAVGFVQYPILWKEYSDGEWKYEILFEEAFHPDGFSFPAFPGEWDGNTPYFLDFMTEEEAAAYEAAYQAYADADYVGEEPDPFSYMTAEEIEAYNAYVEEYNAWNDMFIDWYTAYNDFCDLCPSFQMNDFHLSANGQYMVTSNATPIDDPLAWGRAVSYSPWLYDISTETLAKYEDFGNIAATFAANDGTILATSNDHKKSFVIQNGSCTGMQEWIGSKVPTYGEWIEENMVFPSFDGYGDEVKDEWVETMEEVVMTGVPTGTPDLSKIGVWIQNDWDYMTEAEAYIFDIEAGINGIDRVNAQTEGKTIFDLSGRELREISAPGIYIINGKKVMVK